MEQAKPIEQLYYTWSTIGYGHGARYQVRAVSEGLKDINSPRLHDIENYLQYNLPSGTDAYKATTEQSPTCLIYISTSKESILAYKVHIGKKDYSDYGNYFIHLLAGLPEDFVARDAIDLWRSSFWDSNDSKVENARNLPVMPLSALTNLRSNANEQNLLKAKDFVKQFLPLVMQAYLSAGEMRKLYIAGTPDQVALLIWGLTHCLPRTMQRDLTFSTYERERDILNTPARIVGTCHPQTDILKGYILPSQLILPECYSKGIVIDCYAGKHSDLSFVPEEIRLFVEQATTWLVEGNSRELNAVLASAEKAGVRDTAQLLLSLKLSGSLPGNNTFTKAEIIGVLHDASKVLFYLRQEMIQRAIIGFASNDLRWWNEQISPIILDLWSSAFDAQRKESNSVLRSFAIKVASELCTVIMQNKGTNYQALQHMLVLLAPPALDAKPWVQILRYFVEQSKTDKSFHPTMVPWEKRAWFLSQWAVCNQSPINEHMQATYAPPIPDDMIFFWLQLNDWDEFLNLLDIKALPVRWYQGAFIDMLIRSNGSPPKQIIKLFNNPVHYALFMGALVHMVEQEQGLPGVLNCFHALAQSNFRGLVQALATLLGAGTLKPKAATALFDAALLNSKEKLHLLENYHQYLVPRESQRKAPEAVVEIIEAYLNTLRWDKLTTVSVAALTYLDEQQSRLSQSIVTTLRYWLVISTTLDVQESVLHITLSPNYLKALGAAIQYFKLQNDKKYRAQLFALLVATITTDTDVRNVLKNLAPPLGSEDELRRELATYIKGSLTNQVPSTLFLPYVEEALARAGTMRKDTDKEKFLATFFDILFHGNKKLFNQFDTIAHRWSDSMRQDWELYAGKSGLRPINVLGFVSSLARGAVEMGTERLRLPAKPSQDQPMNVPPTSTPSYGTPFQQPFEQQSFEQGMSPTMDGYSSGNMPYDTNMLEARIQNGQPEPQSIVNGIPIYPEQIVRLYKLKDLYIRLRLDELERAAEHARKKRLSVDWIVEEMEELHEYHNIEYAMKALENDILIWYALDQYSQQANASRDASSDPVALLNEMYGETFNQVKKQREYRQVLGNGYSDNDMQEVLYVFLRYRALATLFRNQGRDVQMRDWLQQQRSRAAIRRNELMPLPQVE